MAGVGPDTFAGVRTRTKPYVLLRARILRINKYVCLFILETSQVRQTCGISSKIHGWLTLLAVFDGFRCATSYDYHPNWVLAIFAVSLLVGLLGLDFGPITANTRDLALLFDIFIIFKGERPGFGRLSNQRCSVKG